MSLVSNLAREETTRDAKHENIICPLCHANDPESYLTSVDYISKESFCLSKCTRCGFYYTNPRPYIEDLKNYYPATHQESKPALYERMDLKPRVQFVSKFVDFNKMRGARALDIGCGKGLFLKYLKDKNWYALGTEISQLSSTYARSMGIEVFHAALADCKFLSNSFNLITLFHSLEHLPEPKLVVQEIERILCPGGLLVIEVPNFDSCYAKLFGSYWFHLDLPRHLNHFTPETLASLLKEAALDIKHSSTHYITYDAYGAVQSILNLILPKKNLLNDFNTGELSCLGIWKGKDPLITFFSLLISELFFIFCMPMAMLFAWLASKFIDGGTLRICAIKRKQEGAINV